MSHEAGLAISVISNLAEELVTNSNLMDTAYSACAGCVNVFSGAIAGVLISNNLDELRVIASSNENDAVHDLLDALGKHREVVDLQRNNNSHLLLDIESDEEDSSFPTLALTHGFRTAVAIPLKLRQTRVGIMTVLWAKKRTVRDHDLTTLRAFANLTSASLMSEQAEITERSLAVVLDRTYQNRVRLEQAKGMVAAARNCSIELAFLAMQQTSQQMSINLTALAHMIVTREINSALPKN